MRIRLSSRRTAATDSLSVSHVTDDVRPSLLRVSPRLPRTGRYALRIRHSPPLGFPEQGHTGAGRVGGLPTG